MRELSSGPIPAIGSSSSSIRAGRKRHGDLELPMLAMAKLGDEHVAPLGEPYTRQCRAGGGANASSLRAARQK